VAPDRRLRAHGWAGHVRVTGPFGALRGAGVAWPARDDWNARVLLWSGPRAWRGEFLAQSGARGAPRWQWRAHASAPWQARTELARARLSFLCPPPAVPLAAVRLRIVLSASPAALARLRSAAPWLADAGDAALARQLVARADLPFACSAAAGHVRLELAALTRLASGPCDAASDPWARWTVHAERAAGQRVALESLLVQHDADALIELQDFGPEAAAQGLAGYAPRVPLAGARRYALVDARAAFDDWTLAHELGHLIGAGHAPAQGSAVTLDRMARAGLPLAPRGVSFASARGWQSPHLGLQTVMGGLGRDAAAPLATVPLWSEPGLDWVGEPIARVGTAARGAAGLADDAGWWAQAVAGFRRARGHGS
jgi:hypothetical protein